MTGTPTAFYTGIIVEPMEWAIYVTEDDRTEPLKLRLDLVNHSPTGFSWGYWGSGPSQAALAILADATGDDELAVRLHHSFMQDFIGKFEKDKDWQLAAKDVFDWVDAQEDTR